MSCFYQKNDSTNSVEVEGESTYVDVIQSSRGVKVLDDISSWRTVVPPPYLLFVDVSWQQIYDSLPPRDLPLV